MLQKLTMAVFLVVLVLAWVSPIQAQQPDSMYYEVVQTNPPLGTPPTPQDGFCSSNGGALGCDNLQKYRLLNGDGNSIIGNWVSAGADVAPLLATFYDTIYAEFRSDNTYEVTAIDPNGVATQFQGTYTATPSGVGNIFSITLQQTAPYAATVEGIFEINPAPLTGIKEVEQPIEGYRLLQNYPNPFNPSTNIAFRLAKRSQVSLKIFNALGEEVATLVDGVLPAGEHEVTFQANDLPSGIYFYRLKAGNFISARQMVLSR